jgi:YidC/Oxa1 family membrane protein insertase
MEKRVLVAVVLSFLVLWGFQSLVVKKTPPGVKKGAPIAAGKAGSSVGATTQGGAASPAAPGAASPAATPAPASTSAVSGAKPAAAATVAETAERDIVVETKTVRAVFTNRGAHLKSWRLKHYLDLQKRPQELVPSGPMTASRESSVRSASRSS